MEISAFGLLYSKGLCKKTNKLCEGNMKTFQYEVIPLDAYKIIAKCPTCKTKKRFYSSGKFRVNANNKSLDVWLIYNCEKCDTTHNVRIYSGINPKQLDNTVLERFMNNDSELALFYGTSKNLFSSNNEVIDSNSLEYSISSRNNMNVSEAILENEDILITIDNKYELRLRTEKILATILGISRSSVKKYIKLEHIIFDNDYLQQNNTILIKGGFA